MGGVKGGFTLINEAIKDNGSKVSHVSKSKAVNYENRKNPAWTYAVRSELAVLV